MPSSAFSHSRSLQPINFSMIRNNARNTLDLDSPLVLLVQMSHVGQLDQSHTGADAVDDVALQRVGRATQHHFSIISPSGNKRDTQPIHAVCFSYTTHRGRAGEIFIECRRWELNPLSTAEKLLGKMEAM